MLNCKGWGHSYQEYSSLLKKKAVRGWEHGGWSDHGGSGVGCSHDGGRGVPPYNNCGGGLHTLSEVKFMDLYRALGAKV